MRIKSNTAKKDISILVIDDDINVTASIRAYLERRGYTADEENDPLEAVKRVQTGNYDILLLDYLMSPLRGDEVVEQIRRNNRDISIILVTGHKDMAPPIETLESLEIQDYYEKNGKLDQLLIRVASCAKAIKQGRTIKEYQKGTDLILERIPGLYGCSIDKAADEILETSLLLSASERGRVEITAGGKEYLAGDYDLEAGSLLEEKIGDPSGIVSGRIVLEAEERRDTESRLLRVLAWQAAWALSNRYLFDKVEDSLSRLEKSYLDTVKGLRNTVEMRDRYTLGHSDRVSAMSAAIAEEMGLEEDAVRRVTLAGTFHDIGKIGVADSILLKDGRLTEEEFEEMKKHPDKGVGILSAIEMFKGILPAVRFHHERIDGRGYPKGLKGDEIPVEARIVAVADCFDAMTSDRTYRRALSFEEALNELQKVSGSQLDGNIVEVFLKIAEPMFTNFR